MKLLRTAIGTLLLALFVTPVTALAQGTIGVVVTITGFMLNGNSLTPVEAAYSVYDAQGKKIGQSHRANEKDGFLITGLKPGETYKVRVEDPRYFKQEFVVALPNTNKYTEISKDFVVRPLEVGKKIMLLPPPFDLRKDDIKDGTEEDLAELAKTLMMNPNVGVEVVCYPDEDGPADQIRTFSTKRGQALKTFLEQNGVNGSRVTVRPASTTDPLNPPPLKKGAKGKRYVGSVYVVVTKV